MTKILLSCFLTCLAYFSYGQACSSAPVKEAVRNGSFEAGYLSGPKDNSHTFEEGGNFDFYSDLNFAGEWTGPDSPCDYGIADEYGIAKAEKTPCKHGPNNNVPYGLYLPSGIYKDHTTNTEDGFSLICDFNQKINSSKSRNGNPIIWEQELNIIPSQDYYFSFWTANYGATSITPQFEIDIIGVKNGVVDSINAELIAITGTPSGIMEWKQFFSTWKNSNSYEKVILRMQLTNAKNNGPSGLDFAIDDISFINSSMNVENYASTFQFDKKEISICYENGQVNLELKDDKGNAINSEGKTITWYKGIGNTQNEITSFANKSSILVTEASEYRACILDPLNTGKSFNTSINVTEKKLAINLEDAFLCNPSSVMLDDKLSQSGLVHTWTGQKTGSSQTILADEPGVYTVTVSLPNYPNCTATSTSTVTSTLPTAPIDLTYCSPISNEILLSHPDTSKTWKWCKDGNCDTEIGNSKNSVLYNVQVPGNQTVYLVDSSVDSLGIVGPSLNNLTNVFLPQSGKKHHTYFNAQQNIFIESVAINTCSFCQNQNINIKLIDDNQKVIQEYSTTLTKTGKQIIPIKFNVNKGDNYTLELFSNNFTATTNNSTKLYSIKDYINITGYNTNNSEGVLADWQISKSNSCAPIPVIIEEKCVISNNTEHVNNSISITPNPFENNTTISVNTESSIIIYNVNGKVIASFENVNEVLIGNNFTSGIYFISIQNEEGVFYEKVIKQ